MADLETFKEEIEPLQEQMHAWAFRMTKDVDDADDLCQDTLIKALSNMDKYTPGSSPKAWIKVMMLRLWLTTKRKRENKAEKDAKLITKTNLEYTFDSYGKADSLLINPSTAEVSEEVIAQINTIRPEFRDIVLDVDLLGMAYLEAAAKHDIPVGTVMSRLHRGRSILRKRLARYAFENNIIPASNPEIAKFLSMMSKKEPVDA
jgi:RNA polymerase sigma-70 factor (ECF subfamily)